MPRLFGKFSRVDEQERRRSLAGSGLGLAICKGIVEAHGGRILAEAPDRAWGALNFLERRVTVAGRPAVLTATEYRLLVELASNPGRVITSSHLLERIWGAGHSAGTAPVRNIVSRLRRKLGDDASNPTYIFNEPRE